MPMFAGFEGSLWSLFLVFFLVGPVLGWGWRSGGRARLRWSRWGWEDAESLRGCREQYDALAAELGERNAVIEQLESRVAELENRLDFAERLLAAQRQPHPELVSPPPVAAGSDRTLS